MKPEDLVKLINKMLEDDYEELGAYLYVFWGKSGLQHFLREIPGVDIVYETFFLLEGTKGPSKYIIMLDPRYGTKWVCRQIQMVLKSGTRYSKIKVLSDVEEKVTWSHYETYCFSNLLSDAHTKAAMIWTKYAHKFDSKQIKIQQYVFGPSINFSYRLLGNGFMYDIGEKSISNAWGESMGINDLREVMGHLLILEYALLLE